MHHRRLEQVIVNLIRVLDRANEVRAQVALVAEGLEAAPRAYVRVLDDGRFVRGVCFRVDPDFDFDGAGAVVEAVGYVCGLLGDVADLADYCDLSR
jgi:hypothetical protein